MKSFIKTYRKYVNVWVSHSSENSCRVLRQENIPQAILHFVVSACQTAPQYECINYN